MPLYRVSVSTTYRVDLDLFAEAPGVLEAREQVLLGMDLPTLFNGEMSRLIKAGSACPGLLTIEATELQRPVVETVTGRINADLD